MSAHKLTDAKLLEEIKRLSREELTTWRMEAENVQGF